MPNRRWAVCWLAIFHDAKLSRFTSEHQRQIKVALGPKGEVCKKSDQHSEHFDELNVQGRRI